MGGSRGVTGRWSVVALLVLLLAGLAVVVSAAGPAEFGEPRLPGIAGLDAPFGAEDGGWTPGESDPDPREDERGLPGWTTVVWAMAVCMALVLAVRWVLTMLRPDDGAAAEKGDEGSVESRGQLHVLSLLRQGVKDAAGELGDPVPDHAERDAVIRAWLALEDAASRAGAGRRAAQTPTEFTTALLDAHHADAAATATLLTLYHRARFGSRPVAPDDIRRARHALERIAASLQPTADELTDHGAGHA